MATRSWSRVEVEATVAHYLEMLAAELRGEDYSKTEHRRRLLRLLDNRTDGAVELKHQNISAVLIELGVPYVSGYKPASNYQKLLAEVVTDRVGKAEDLAKLVANDAEVAPVPPRLDDILAALVDGPERERLQELARSRAGRAGGDRTITSDYLAQEAGNERLGQTGEEFVVAFERARLVQAGQPNLADRVEHVAKTKGDGLGFDVLSFEAKGQDRLIEVKTTKYGMYTPFYVTRNELRVSQGRPTEYHLYRVFEFRRAPRLFVRPGDLSKTCHLDPVQFVGRVA